MKIFLPLVFLLVSVFGFSQISTFIDGELIIMLQPKTDVQLLSNKINQSYENLGAEVTETLSKKLRIHLMRYNSALYSNQFVVDIFNEYPEVIHAQLNYSNFDYRDSVPNDNLFSNQWAHIAMQSTRAWAKPQTGTTVLGDTIVVAVIDGGAQPHEDLSFFVNKHEIPNNNIDDDNNGYIDDVSGWNVYDNNGNIPSDFHGNHVSGIIGAKGNNDLGVTGVNWFVKILPIAGSSSNQATVVKAYDYVYNMRYLYNKSQGDSGAFVVATNSSFGRNNANPLNYPIWCAFYDSLGKVGVLSAGATANANNDVDQVGDMPTACQSEFMIAVTNTTQSNNKSNWAAYGKTTIDIGAPGTDILSTGLNNNYSESSGTSMATPQVAGAIALMYNHVCDIMWQQYQNDHEGLARKLKDILLTEGFDSIPSLKDITVTGGRLNVNKAILGVKNYCNVLGLSEFDKKNNGFLVYPNPSASEVNIITNSLQPILIYGITGNLIRKINVINNNIRVQLPAGVYVFKQLKAEGFYYSRVIIN